MEAEIEVQEAMLARAKELRLSPDPEKAMYAAKHEMRLQTELDVLRRHRQSRKQRAGATG
jgi:hypothetical protein